MTIELFLGALEKLLKVTISFVVSVRMEQLGSNWTDFQEIRYLRIFRKPVKKIQVSLNSDKNEWYFTWRPTHIFYHISLISSYNETFFRQKIQRQSKHAFCVQ